MSCVCVLSVCHQIINDIENNSQYHPFCLFLSSQLKDVEDAWLCGKLSLLVACQIVLHTKKWCAVRDTVVCRVFNESPAVEENDRQYDLFEQRKFLLTWLSVAFYYWMLLGCSTARNAIQMKPNQVTSCFSH